MWQNNAETFCVTKGLLAFSDFEDFDIRDIVFGRLVQAKQLLADTLSPLLVPGQPGGKGIQGFKGTHQSPPGLPRSNNVPHHSIQDAQLSSHNDEVPIDDQVCPKLFKYETRKVWGPSYDTLGASLSTKWPKRSISMCAWFCVPALPHNTAGAPPCKDDPWHRPPC